MSRLSSDLFRANVRAHLAETDTDKFFRYMPRSMRIRWAVRKALTELRGGPKCRIGGGSGGAPAMFVRSYFR